MSTCRAQHPLDLQGHFRGWAVSLLVHATAVAFAIVLVSDLRLAPQPEVFKWDVAVLDPPKPVPKEQPTSPQARPQAAPTPAPRTPTKSRPVEREPVIQTVQTVERVIHRQEAREVQASPTVTQQALPAEVRAQPVVAAAAPVIAQAAESYATAPAALDATPHTISRHSMVSGDIGQPVTREEAVAKTPVHPGDEGVGPVVHRPVSTAVGAPPAPVAATVPIRSGPAAKADFGWLIEAIRSRVEHRKGYPHLARMNRWEGTVTIMVRLKPAGQEALLADARIEESSGYAVLDSHALEVIREAFPLPLKYPLEKTQTFSYSLAFRMAQ